MRPPILPDVARFWIYAAAFTAWVVVQGAGAYYAALDWTPPNIVIGSQGVVDWVIGAGLLTAATHTARTNAKHTDVDGDGYAG